MNFKQPLPMLERKVQQKELKLQKLTRFHWKEAQKEIYQLHHELNVLWKQISALARKERKVNTKDE